MIKMSNYFTERSVVDSAFCAQLELRELQFNCRAIVLTGLEYLSHRFPNFLKQNRTTFSLFMSYMTFISGDGIDPIRRKAAKKSVSGNSLKWRPRNDRRECISVPFSCHFKIESDCTNKSRHRHAGGNFQLLQQ